MAVILSRYRDSEFMVTKDGVTKCRHKPEERARAFAARLAGDEDYVDLTREVEKKPKKSKKTKD